MVIYRLSRAPERSIFYIDVGNLPKQKAEQYLREVMSRYSNKLVYNADTGEIRDDKKFMSMLEDFWAKSGRRKRHRDHYAPRWTKSWRIGGRKVFPEETLQITQRAQSHVWNLTLPSTLVDPQRSPAMKLNSKNSSLDSAKSFSDVFNDLLKTQLV